MKKSDQITFIIETLDALFPNPPIPLWHKDPYTLLIAVLLSAQCQDVRVNQVTPALFKKAATPQRMQDVDVLEIEKLIRPCGLSGRKASAIKELSKLLMHRHGGQVPETFKELERLPGVGHKTASVVMSQAFGKCAFPVDTHVYRLARRWGLSQGKTVEKVESDLKKIFPKQLWGKLHLQMIYFARKYCKATKHEKTVCPICSKI